MELRHTRRWVLLILLVLDVTGLSVATAYIMRGPRASKATADEAITPAPAAAPAATPAPNPAPAQSATPATPAAPAGLSAPVVSPTPAKPAMPTPTPVRVARSADRPIAGAPRFILCGATDTAGNTWLGSEDQGVYRYSADGLQHFGAAEGLGDDNACAVACDALGRVWVGLASNGVSVFNGQSWRNYTRFNGPCGSRVFCIATCPTDGDVWLGTDAGLTRYSLKNDTWTTFDRSTGMPACQASGIAFDSSGNIYVGLQADGVAMARAADGYAKWTSIIGPDDTPIVASGPGLASRLVNAVLVTRDDVVYAGTCRGLARSTDQGASWSYVRGKNWVQLAKDRYDGVPPGFQAAVDSPLAEDWVSALAQDAAGAIWVGYRDSGFDAFTAFDGSRPAYHGKGIVTAIVPTKSGCVIGLYGAGALQCGTVFKSDIAPPSAASVASALKASDFPSPARAPGAPELAALRARVESLPPAGDGADFLGDDWETMGDWEGRYGNQWAEILSFSPMHREVGYGADFETGPYRQGGMGGWRIYYQKQPEKERALLDPQDGKRVGSEINDGSYMVNEFPRTQEGPDLYVHLTLPGGVHRVSLYFHNFDGHTGANNGRRDWLLEVKHPGAAQAAALQPADAAAAAAAAAEAAQALEDLDGPPRENGNGIRNRDPQGAADAELSPTLARARVPRYWMGVYKQFLIRGAGDYWIKINRNHGVGTKVQGVFIDRLDQPSQGGGAYPQPPSAKDYTQSAGALGAAAKLWAALDAAVGKSGYSDIAPAARVAAYRVAVAAGMDESTLSHWRWQLPAWTPSDRGEFDAYADKLAASH